MVSHFVTLPNNILNNINFGSNVNTVINKMFKLSIIFVGILLIGCAGQPKQYQPADMKNFIASCKDARFQVDYLNVKINEYLEYHRNNPPTLEDRRYYEKLKNNLWSLRASCSAKQL